MTKYGKVPGVNIHARNCMLGLALTSVLQIIVNNSTLFYRFVMAAQQTPPWSTGCVGAHYLTPSSHNPTSSTYASRVTIQWNGMALRLHGHLPLKVRTHLIILWNSSDYFIMLNMVTFFKWFLKVLDCEYSDWMSPKYTKQKSIISPCCVGQHRDQIQALS